MATERFFAAGIAKPGCCHLRHTAATMMLDNGADVRHIQALLGHSDLNSTQTYTHVSIAKLREVHDATHPAKPGRSEELRDRSEEPKKDDDDADGSLVPV